MTVDCTRSRGHQLLTNVLMKYGYVLAGWNVDEWWPNDHSIFVLAENYQNLTTVLRPDLVHNNPLLTKRTGVRSTENIAAFLDRKKPMLGDSKWKTWKYFHLLEHTLGVEVKIVADQVMIREFSLWRDNVPTRTNVLFVVPWERSYLNVFGRGYVEHYESGVGSESSADWDAASAEAYAGGEAADDKRLPWDVRLRLHLAETDYDRLCGTTA